MKSQVDLLVGFLLDAGSTLGFDPSRDIITLTKRYETKGFPFLSTVLPRLDDALIAGLRDGRLPGFPGWKTRHAYPEFLSGLWARIFSQDGMLLDNPCHESIRSIRQITRAFKKVFEVCGLDRVDAAIERFVEIDSALPSSAETKSSVDSMASEVAQILFGRLIGEAVSAPIVGRHGPGAVSERVGSNSRWDFPVVSESISSLAGYDLFRPTWESLLEAPPETATIPARLVAVPKTAEKPRLISIEPSYNQFVQQSLMQYLYKGFERYDLICNTADQGHNRRLALESSRQQHLATIDLSDASDRVSLALVDVLFGFNPSFMRYLRLSRSPFVQLPDGSLVLLNKFASMGSALTFPVEAMVFTTLAITAICRAEGDFSPARIRELGKRGHLGLSVYGDDIIVPVDRAQCVMDALETVGLKVNREKSFYTGAFRESCGLDAYGGTEVSPSYVRRHLPTSITDSEGVLSWTSLRNQIRSRFPYWKATLRRLDSHLGGLGVPHVPQNDSEDVGLWCDSTDSRIRWRRNAALQRAEFKGLKPVVSRRADEATYYGKLYKSLSLNKGPLSVHRKVESTRVRYYADEPSVESFDHLREDSRAVAVKLYHRWFEYRV